MKIAISVWNGFVSNVLDFADQLLVVDVEGQEEVGRSEFQLGQQAIQQWARLLAKLNVDVLICGGISESLASMLAASRIEIIPFVTGQVDESVGRATISAAREPDRCKKAFLP